MEMSYCQYFTRLTKHRWFRCMWSNWTCETHLIQLVSQASPVATNTNTSCEVHHETDGQLLRMLCAPVITYFICYTWKVRCNSLYIMSISGDHIYKIKLALWISFEKLFLCNRSCRKCKNRSSLILFKENLSIFSHFSNQIHVCNDYERFYANSGHACLVRE